MKRFIKTTVLLLLWASVKGQIINIENARMQSDTTGLMGNAGAALSLNKNTNEVFVFNAHTHLQYKTKKSLYLLIGSYGFLKATGTNLINNSFLHLRYNYKLSTVLRWELFTQWQQNVITKIDYRFLTGTGPRFKIAASNKLRLYAASLIMYEYEKELAMPSIIHKDWRNSSYISFSLLPNKSTELVSTTFYQPLVGNISDYRIMNQTQLKVKATSHLSIAMSYNYLFDNYPAKGTPKTNYHFSTGIDYDF